MVFCSQRHYTPLRPDSCLFLNGVLWPVDNYGILGENTRFVLKMILKQICQTSDGYSVLKLIQNIYITHSVKDVIHLLKCFHCFYFSKFYQKLLVKSAGTEKQGFVKTFPQLVLNIRFSKSHE